MGRPELSLKERKRRQAENLKKYRSKPENIEKIKAYHKAYSQRPEVKERVKEYHKEYYKRPEVKARVDAYIKEYNMRPYVVEKRREAGKKYYEAHKYDELDLDTVVKFLKANPQGVNRKTMPPAGKAIRIGKKIGVVVEDESGVVKLKESPMLSALDGAFEAWNDKFDEVKNMVAPKSEVIRGD